MFQCGQSVDTYQKRKGALDSTIKTAVQKNIVPNAAEKYLWHRKHESEEDMTMDKQRETDQSTDSSTASQDAHDPPSGAVTFSADDSKSSSQNASDAE